MDEIGLFPLRLVVFPGERAPLHIFEDRYKELIDECIDKNAEFGIVLFEESGIHSVGTRAAVVDVLEREDDGRMNVLVEGRARFKVERITAGRSFMTAEVEDISDEDAEADAEDVNRCVTAYEQVIEAAGGEGEELEPEDLSSFRMGARVSLSPDVKQELLETRSENERLYQLAEIFESAAKGVEFQRMARRRAIGNGLVESP